MIMLQNASIHESTCNIFVLSVLYVCSVTGSVEFCHREASLVTERTFAMNDYTKYSYTVRF